MIVPQYWAEARVQERQRKKQLTVRRFGWSDQSQEDAQAKAEERARAAFDRISSGEKLPKHEPKVAYNGADGVPIREEILARDGDTVVTRNAYGASCINTPNVLFADIDLADTSSAAFSSLITFALVGLGALAAWLNDSWLIFGGAVMVAVTVASFLSKREKQQSTQRTEATRTAAHKRIDDFVVAHPDWHVRVYETPAGFRALVMHRTFEVDDIAVQAFFKALQCDPIYVRMCNNQKCFRARVSPKPWRIDMSHHIRPRPGVWPVKPEHLSLRQQWIDEYEAKAKHYASCRFVAALGASTVAPQALSVQTLHDAMSQATASLPIA